MIWQTDTSDLIGEIWRGAPAFPTYAVSNLGRIKRLAVADDKGHVPSERLLRVKRAEVWLRCEGQSQFIQLARLILEAFKGPPPSSAHKARHLDDNRENNTLANLEWGTQQDNVRDALRNGIFGPSGRIQPDEERAKRRQAQLGRKHPDAVKQKMSATGKSRMAARKAAGIVQRPSASFIFSGIGTKWATNGDQNKLLSRTDSLPEGWKWGRILKKMRGNAHAAGRRWATNGAISKMFSPNTSLPEGWRWGRA